MKAFMNSTSLFFKFCELLLATTALLNFFLFILQFLPVSFFDHYGYYFEYVLLFSIGVTTLISLIYAWLWHKREIANYEYSALHHAWLQGLIRYWLALSISSYGFAKLLKTQFQTADYRLDMTLGSVEGMGLTWYYFGYSYSFAVIIGLFQIVGSILLLYRRTTLLGTMILLPVMVNIVLINLFFKISAGALFNSVIYLLSLFFLASLNIEKLKIAFWLYINQLPNISVGPSWVKHCLHVLLIGGAYVSLEVLVAINPYDQTLKGTWKVEKLLRNGQLQSPNAWLIDKFAWCRIYFADFDECTFSPNPYRFEPTESLFGSYKLDSKKKTLRIIFLPSDTMYATISNFTTESMRFQGVLRSDTLDMHLTRLHR